MLKYNIHIKQNTFFYMEFDTILSYSKLGISKIKHGNFKMSFARNNNIYYVYLHELTKNITNYIFKISEFGFLVKYELIGMGYRQYYRNQCIVFQLWYNHLISKIIPYNILTYKKKKKRRYNALFGFNKNRINTILYLWLSYRIKNVYTGKGISKKGKKYMRKQMIKKLL